MQRWVFCCDLKAASDSGDQTAQGNSHHYLGAVTAPYDLHNIYSMYVMRMLQASRSKFHVLHSEMCPSRILKTNTSAARGAIVSSGQRLASHQTIILQSLIFQRCVLSLASRPKKVKVNSYQRVCDFFVIWLCTPQQERTRVFSSERSGCCDCCFLLWKRLDGSLIL